MTDTIRMLAVSGLAYEDEAPLGWKPLPSLPQGAELQQLNAQNTHLLQADSSLEEHRVPTEPTDETHPLHQELHRLEFKLDLALRLLATLMEQHHAAPSPRKYRIYSQGLEWIAPAPGLKTGEKGVLAVHINRALPYPIELPAEVVTTYPAGEQTAVRVEFRGLSGAVTELLEKMIFRHHRRQIAESRAQGR